MSYRIEYSKQQNKYVKIHEHVRVPVLSFSFFFLFLMLVRFLWPDGAVWLYNKLLVFRTAVSISALNDMADVLQEKSAITVDLTETLSNLIP